MIGAPTVIAGNPTAVKAHQPILNRIHSQEKELLLITAHCNHQMLLDPELDQRRFTHTVTLIEDSEATPGDEGWEY